MVKNSGYIGENEVRMVKNGAFRQLPETIFPYHQIINGVD